MGGSCTKEEEYQVQTSAVVYVGHQQNVQPAQEQRQVIHHQTYVATLQQPLASSRSVGSSHPAVDYSNSRSLSNLNHSNSYSYSPPQPQPQPRQQPQPLQHVAPSAPPHNVVLSPTSATAATLQAEADAEAMWGRQDTEVILAHLAANGESPPPRPNVNPIDIGRANNNPDLEAAVARSLSTAREDEERRRRASQQEADMSVVLEMIRDQENQSSSYRTRPPISDSDSGSSTSAGAPVPLRDCPVCLEERSADEIVFLHCMHSLCRPCCTDWAAKKRQQEATICCPICNTDLPAEVVISLNL
eukprot:TRINITY_DN3478_c0_g3_i2.p1 TRINITY_DN3478_c0_g3~~TRINITY_DN3478_c0_g3_i2.p1  ORF type:complete len:317 (+),score=59.34 TRINITY_DN3478_c0_g3_i2:46-951(+)